MNIKDLLQCDQCNKDLEDFLSKFPNASKETVEALELFAVFLEMRRLKRKQINPVIQTGIRTKDVQIPMDTSKYTLTC